jgi:hypothetical protein
MSAPGHTALGAWSGGRYMHFGEPIDDDRFVRLLRPDAAIHTVVTADVYGAGEADRAVGRALSGLPRESFSLVGAIGHDFYGTQRDGAKGFPRFTSQRAPDAYAGYLREAAERSLERCGVGSFDVLLLHNPDRVGYTSPAVWEAMAGLRAAGLCSAIGVAPGPANGFTLDVIGCLERFGDLIDWAMLILNPLEPWPGASRCLPASATASACSRASSTTAGCSTTTCPTRASDRGRSSPLPARRLGRRRPGPAGRAAADCRQARADDAAIVVRLDAVAAGRRVRGTTLIQETGPLAKPVEAKREELAAVPASRR